jgi:pimeloyl-ACP methyl ester carboxylesterase
MKRVLCAVFLLLVAAIAGITGYGILYKPQENLPVGLKGEFLDVMGVHTRYVQSGNGPDVLLIHGSTSSVEDWAPVMEALAPDFRVTAYDRPGHGYSSTGARYDYDYNAEFALAMIHALHLQDVVVAGHSYGGAIAMALAIRKPAEVKGFVVVDSSLYRWARKPDPAYRLLAIPGFGTGLARLTADSVAPRKIRSALEALFPPGTMPAGFVEARIPIWSQPKVAVSVAHEALGAQAWLDAMSPHYREISQPVFIIAQADDPIRRDNAEMLHRHVAGSELQLVSGTGHFIQFQKTGDVVALIRKAAAASR